MRFYYTSTLRQYDAGIFAVGYKVSPYMIIPPKQESWLTVGYCAKECNQVNCRRIFNWTTQNSYSGSFSLHVYSLCYVALQQIFQSKPWKYQRCSLSCIQNMWTEWKLVTILSATLPLQPFSVFAVTYWSFHLNVHSFPYGLIIAYFWRVLILLSFFFG